MPSINNDVISLGQYRWDPFLLLKWDTFVTGMRTITTTGDVSMQMGMVPHVYVADKSMDKDYFYSADSELLVNPQLGGIVFKTEFGLIEILHGRRMINRTVFSVLPRRDLPLFA